VSGQHPDVIPIIAYEDGASALDWLSRAFGFRERTRPVDAGGRINHAEMECGAGMTMLATPTPALPRRGPRRSPLDVHATTDVTEARRSRALRRSRGCA
jgi:uncharacterized glyoxalase superfamily protein PhnB